jgi:carboxyvinyl-carboxyphosphonate phosphorylmutase
MVDADHGYGNALNVMRTVEELETAGVSGLSIEDTKLPEPYGKSGSAKLTSIEEGVGKMRAALEARQDPNLVIAGRTSAPQITGIEDTIKRVNAYEKAGVDAIFLVGIKTRKQLEGISPAIRIPIILGTIGPKLRDIDYLSRQGVRIALQGHQPIMASIQAVHVTLKALREGTPPEKLNNLADDDLKKQVTCDASVGRWRKKFLRGES